MSISQLEKPDGSLTNHNNEVVEELKIFLQSVFNQEDPLSVPEFPTKVHSSLNEIKTHGSVSCGPHGHTR